MQHRERILALIVAGLLLAVVGVWGGWRATAMLRDRGKTLAGLQGEVARTNLLQSQLEEIKDRKARFAERSLPSHADVAKEKYAQWLTTLVREKGIELQEVKVDSLEEAPDKEHDFTKLKFQVVGHGSYPQLVRLLERFYAADHLHKIAGLRVTPSSAKEGRARDRELSITLTIEALALGKSANKEALSTLPSGEATPKDLRAAVDQLMLRHFYRANRPPQLGVADAVTAMLGRSVQVALRAGDADGDRLAYELVSHDLIDGKPWLKLNGDMLSSTENPPLGTYKATVRVTDSGLPPKQVEKTFSIRVQQPPPPPPVKVAKKFDHTKHAYVEGLFERNGKPEVWIKVRTVGKELTLYVGSEEEIEGVKIKVLSIDLDKRLVEIQFPDGRRSSVALGKSLGGD